MILHVELCSILILPLYILKSFQSGLEITSFVLMTLEHFTKLFYIFLIKNNPKIKYKNESKFLVVKFKYTALYLLLKIM